MPNSAVPSFQNPDAYEQVMGRWSRRLAPLLIRFGGLSDDDRVLDVGCGTGSLAFTVAEIANVASVTGIDLTEPFLEFSAFQGSKRTGRRQTVPSAPRL
jgi:ubiquinone/menaquinone biosynthesis C-methylase UbiE